MLSRTLKFCLSQGHKHLNHTELTHKMSELRAKIEKSSEELKHLRQQVKQKENEANLKNKDIMEKRLKLTEDVKKSEKVWENAKKQSQSNKAAAIHSFAGDLISLGDHFELIKQHQTEAHSVDLRQGFENTARLFFNTLQKFGIGQVEVKVGEKVSRDSVQIAGEEKGQGGQKDKVIRVVSPGWQVNKKILRKPKVVVHS